MTMRFPVNHFASDRYVILWKQAGSGQDPVFLLTKFEKVHIVIYHFNN